jgi:fructose-bisphosphate aldolase class I
LAIDQNAETLARYAAISQANGLVPIVEPEVLMDGSHSIQRAAEVCQRVFATCFMKLQGNFLSNFILIPFNSFCSCTEHNILLEGCMLKPNMVRSGIGYNLF